MKCVLILALLAVTLCGAARADSAVELSVSKAAPPRAALNVDGVFDRMMSAAGVGLKSGKIMLLGPVREGRRAQVAVTMGKSRLMPLFDVNFHSASIFAHVSFE